MTLISNNFTEVMTDAGLTREQQERVVAALSKETAIVALIHGRSMDRGDFAAGHRA